MELEVLPEKMHHFIYRRSDVMSKVSLFDSCQDSLILRPVARLVVVQHYRKVYSLVLFLLLNIHGEVFCESFILCPRKKLMMLCSVTGVLLARSTVTGLTF